MFDLNKIALLVSFPKEDFMGMVNELNSELAMAFLRRSQIDARFDREKLPTILKQINLTLRPLSKKADRRTERMSVRVADERTAVANH